MARCQLIDSPQSRASRSLEGVDVTRKKLALWQGVAQRAGTCEPLCRGKLGWQQYGLKANNRFTVHASPMGLGRGFQPRVHRLRNVFERQCCGHVGL